jgi:hypothetical protein
VPGSLTILTPRLTSAPIELGRSTWRKQVLPIGELDYKGRTLRFTRDYLAGLVAAFKARAFDAVPLQLADTEGGHNNDPQRTVGEVIGLEASDDGLYATVSLTDKGSELVREHPNIGVSVRIVEELRRGDGQKFPAALQHVLACWDPRVNGMRPWAAVSCTRESEQVIDLSALSFNAPTGTGSALDTASAGSGEDVTQEGVTPVAENMQPSEEEIVQLRALLARFSPPDGANDSTDGEGDEFTSEELDDIAAPADDPGRDNSDAENSDADEAEELEPLAAANADTDEALALANDRIDAQAVELARLRAERDEERWAREREELLSRYAIAGDIADLAAPLLRGTGHTVELGGRAVDAGDVMRKVLRECGRRYAKALDLNQEIGSAEATADADRRKAEDDKFFAQARRDMRH